MAIFAAARNFSRRNPNHLILYIVHALPAGTFVLDTVFFGNAPHFRKFILPVPILLECILVFMATKTGKLKKPKIQSLVFFWKIFIVGTIIWAIASAFVALAFSRATNCCAKKKEDEDEEEELHDENTNTSTKDVGKDSEEEVYHDVEMGGDTGKVR